MDILQRMPWMAQNAVFQRLSKIADVASLSKEERRQYDESLRAYRDTIVVMEGQFLQGEQKGRAEERRDNARRMKEKGFSTADIADITGLSPADIDKL